MIRTPSSPGRSPDRDSPPREAPAPASAGADPASRFGDLPATAPIGWHPKVLVVDDDEVSRLALVHLLEVLGVTVDVARQGSEGLAMSGRWPYTAIFMDCIMPEIDGYTAASEVRRRDGPDQHTPVIAHTARSQQVSVASGMQYHLDKPLRHDILEHLCTRLGLLDPDQPDGRDWLATAGSEAPLLDQTLLAEGNRENRIRTAKLARSFVERATLQLPELWRAGNRGDGHTIRRLAAAMEKQAAPVGAARVADLCVDLAKAASRIDAGFGRALVADLVLALADTNAAATALAQRTVTFAGP